MAPEFPPRLVVLTLDIVGDSLAAHVENIEPRTSQERLRVHWSDVEAPVGYRSVGSGALYVKESDGVAFDGPRPVELDYLENNRYRWMQGTLPDTLWIMIAMIFPSGYSLRRPRPAPTTAKSFGGRLAVHWCVSGNEFGRVTIEWDLHRPDRSTSEEVRLLNSRSSLEDVPFEAGIDLVEPVATRVERPIKVFLCHASEDKVQVRSLYDQLKRDGFDPWLDQENILPGQDWDAAITQAVRSSDVVLVCLSRTSISKAGYLQKEISRVLDVAEEQPDGAIFIIPVRFDDTDVPEKLRRFQWLDYFEKDAYDRLLQALNKRASQLRQN
jgi:hypothetical protein